MSHQRRSFFSLKCNPPDCAIINDPPLISLCGSTPFTLSARFYISSRESNATIITQEGVFSLEIVKGALRFFSKGLGTFTLDIAKDPLAERDWNKVDIVYDKTNVIIYLQGFPALSAKTSSSQSSFIDKNTPWKMGLMEGYLQDVEFYSQALDKDEVQKLFFSNHHISRDKIELWADFGEYEPLDRSSRKHKLQLTGGCDIVNLVYGITPGKEGCIVPIGTAPVNPGSKECSTFTLLANVLKMNTLPLTKITSGNPVLDITPGRLDFDKSVQEGIKLNPFQVRCHAISYESIEKAIVLCINTANENASHIAKEDYVNLLENLCRAVTLTPEGEVPLSTTMEGSTFLELAFLEEDFNFPLDDEGKKDIVEYCNQLLYSLNSCLPNLRTGMSDWNSSIGANLDLEEWIHVTGDGEQCYVDCAWDNPDIFEILENTILSGLPVPPNVGFYIRNTKDCHRLFHLREFLLGIRNKGASPLKQNPFILRMAHVDLYNELLQDKISDPRKRILSSSNNNWRLNDYIRHNMSSSYPQEEPIYFLAKDSNGNLFWLQWPNAQYMYNIPLPANN